MMKKVGSLVNEGEYYYIISSSLIQILPGKEAKENMEDHIFDVYDSNNDGTIDFSEFMVTVI